MKNTVYALARTDPVEHAEVFAQRLAEHFSGKPSVARAHLSVAEQRWDRLAANGRPHPHAFVQAGDEHWTTVVTRDADASRVVSGLAQRRPQDGRVGVSGFPRDAFTPPRHRRPPPRDLDHPSWTYREARRTSRSATASAPPSSRLCGAPEPFGAAHALCDGEAALAAAPDRPDHATLPNRHHLLVDLAPSGSTTRTRFSWRPKTLRRDRGDVPRDSARLTPSRYDQRLRARVGVVGRRRQPSRRTVAP